MTDTHVPEVTARVEETWAAMEVDGETHTIRADSEEEVRSELLRRTQQIAVDAGSEVRLTTVDRDGQWRLVVSPDGGISETAEPAVVHGAHGTGEIPLGGARPADGGGADSTEAGLDAGQGHGADRDDEVDQDDEIEQDTVVRPRRLSADDDEPSAAAFYGAWPAAPELIPPPPAGPGGRDGGSDDVPRYPESVPTQAMDLSAAMADGALDDLPGDAGETAPPLSGAMIGEVPAGTTPAAPASDPAPAAGTAVAPAPGAPATDVDGTDAPGGPDVPGGLDRADTAPSARLDAASAIGGAPPAAAADAGAPVAAPPAAAPPGIAVPSAAVPSDAETAPAGEQPAALPTLADFRATRPPTVTGPAELGWRGALRRASGGLLRPQPGPAEVAHREAIASVTRSLSGPRTICVINPKGGAHKTTATMLIAATFGIHRGGYTLAWDNNESRGTLGWRAHQSTHSRTAVDLLRDSERFTDPAASRVGDLDDYVRSQADAQFDVLASDEDAAASSEIDGEGFLKLHATLQRFYRIIVVDTGNNMRASNWEAAVDTADQLVIVSAMREDTAGSAAWMVEGLARKGHEEKLRSAVTVLSAPDRAVDDALRQRLNSHFGSLTRAVVEVPYDPALVTGAGITIGAIAPATREAWLNATARIAEGL